MQGGKVGEQGATLVQLEQHSRLLERDLDCDVLAVDPHLQVDHDRIMGEGAAQQQAGEGQQAGDEPPHGWTASASCRPACCTSPAAR